MDLKCLLRVEHLAKRKCVLATEMFYEVFKSKENVGMEQKS